MNNKFLVLCGLASSLVIILIIGGTACSDTRMCSLYSSDLGVATELLVSLEEIESNYCLLLEDIVKYNGDSLGVFCELQFDGENAYNHGKVLVMLVDKLGQEYFLRRISGLSLPSKKRLMFYLSSGLEYGSWTTVRSIKLQENFSLLADYLEADE